MQTVIEYLIDMCNKLLYVWVFAKKSFKCDLRISSQEGT